MRPSPVQHSLTPFFLPGFESFAICFQAANVRLFVLTTVHVGGFRFGMNTCSTYCKPSTPSTIGITLFIIMSHVQELSPSTAATAIATSSAVDAPWSVASVAKTEVFSTHIPAEAVPPTEAVGASATNGSARGVRGKRRQRTRGGGLLSHTATAAIARSVVAWVLTQWHARTSRCVAICKACLVSPPSQRRQQLEPWSHQASASPRATQSVAWEQAHQSCACHLHVNQELPHAQAPVVAHLSPYPLPLQTLATRRSIDWGPIADCQTPAH